MWSRAREHVSSESRFKVALVWGMSALPALLCKPSPCPTPFLTCQARHNPQRCGKDHELMDEAQKAELYLLRGMVQDGKDVVQIIKKVG